MEASSHEEMTMLTKEIPRTNKSFIEKKHLLLYVCNGKYQKSKGPISFIDDIRNQEQKQYFTRFGDGFYCSLHDKL